MTGRAGGRRSLDRGKRGERECAAYVLDLTGFKVRRSQAGNSDDLGDLHGLPDTTLQVADWTDVMRAVREKPLAAEAQRAANDNLFAATHVRLWGGTWRVVLTPEQWAVYVVEGLQR